MLKIQEAVIVEGTYDKAKLKQVMDGVVITTDGFDIFKNPSKRQMVLQFAKSTGVVILTDSDQAGFKIRNYIKSIMPPEMAHAIKHAYIPALLGKERRKAVAGKEGLLGVEGMTIDILEQALRKAGCTIAQSIPKPPTQLVTKADLYADGLLGGEQSSLKRAVILRKLNLPSRISTNGLLEVINTIYGYEQYKSWLNSKG
ncbi:MAG: DUF4093 domain-containing protein [Hyphomonadaceae bacterium]|nr:DUF4093 domain-containing protein [Clostridia bacterium]